MRIARFVAILFVLAGVRAAVADESEAASPQPDASARPQADEEMIVTGRAPAKNRVPPMEYLMQVYDARRQGAHLYKRGRYAEAFPYLLVAAKRGFKFAQARVGFLYQQGLGTPQNPEAAIAWLGVAARGNTMPEIRNHFNALWAKIPETYRPQLEAVIDVYDSKFGAKANRVACDTSHKSGTFVKRLTCRFMDEHLYSDTGETIGEVTATEVALVGN